ncbi:Hypothetical protein SRAE_X000084300 [Strongyloides ratti]|uniref:Uncharacterized protein n=1 Tax=Strongyloides ratti TaxID=34506 RepID=A0A090LV30_STRRB|nr:Hypothetical protein SRAE_X000084300 [Strongyloides ratti]CEF71519.1 Hypothetical protein SRAE_X000084300 [Strongyloides ratti]
MECSKKLIGNFSIEEWLEKLNNIMYDDNCDEDTFLNTIKDFEIELIKEKETCKVLSDIFYKNSNWPLKFFLVLKTRQQFIIDIFIFNEFGWEVFDYIWKSPIPFHDRFEIIKEVGILNFTSTSAPLNENFELLCYTVEYDKYLDSKIDWALQYGIKTSQTQ